MCEYGVCGYTFTNNNTTNIIWYSLGELRRTAGFFYFSQVLHKVGCLSKANPGLKPSSAFLSL